MHTKVSKKTKDKNKKTKDKSNKILFALSIPVLLVIVDILDCIYDIIPIPIVIFDFLITPLYAIVNIVFVIFFVYYFNAHNSYVNSKKRFLIDFINKLIVTIETGNFYEISEENFSELRIKHREVNNKINLLEESFGEFIKPEDLEYINKEWEDYWNKFSENIYKIEEIKSKRSELMKTVKNVESKLEQIMVELF